MEWLEIILGIVTGLAACIPLVIKLVQYIEKAIRAKQWPKLLELVMKFMTDAEKNIEDGATRKEWVLQMVEASAGTVDYDIDMNEVSNLIDSLVEMSKKVNVSKGE
jgi:hypothetical protein